MADRQRAFEFLEAFEPAHRAILSGAAERVELRRGDHLLRRGEPGGDVYLITTGLLEVVDTRSTPEVILAALKSGSVVGEMAFIDDSPRSADVRAGAETVVLRWAREDLRSLLVRHPDLAARFYENVARLASERLRRLTEGTVSGAVATRETNQAGLQRTKEQARDLAERVKDGLLDVDSRLRQDPDDARAAADLHQLLERLQESVEDLLLEHPEPEARDLTDDLLSRELHPYLVRSSLAERCIRRPQGVTGTAEILAHVLVDTAAGDGRLGELLDRWLLDRPTLAALRSFREPTVALVRELLPEDRNRRVLVVNAGTGSLVAQLVEGLSSTRTHLTVVDQSRDALAFLDASVVARHESVELQTVQESLAQFALGRARRAFPYQDAIVVHGLLEYLPERIAVSLLTVCRNLLRPDGVVVASALGPSRDHALIDRILNWPTIRRSEESLCNLGAAAGLDLVRRVDVPAPGVLVALAIRGAR